MDLNISIIQSVSKHRQTGGRTKNKMSSEINFPTYFEILFSKIEHFFSNLSDVEIAIVSSIVFFMFVILLCLLIFIVECLVRFRSCDAKLSPETYFKRSLKVSKKMSKLKTSEFKHFELELKDSGNVSLSSSREPSLRSSGQPGSENYLVDNCGRGQHQNFQQVTSVIV